MEYRILDKEESAEMKLTRRGFVNDVKDGLIAIKVQQSFEQHGIHHNNSAEYRAWSNSLMFNI